MTRKPGVVTAFVKEIDASQGRIKVNFAAIDDNLDSAWAYVASPMTGNKRGQLFMPEPGDEVLVAFGDNDFDTAFVLGFLWNGKQVSPEDTPHHRVIVTPGGHQLRFEDKDSGNPGDGARVILKSDGGHTITLEDGEPKKLEIKSTEHTVLLDDTPGAAKISITAGKAGLVTIDMNTTPPSISLSNGVGTLIIDSTGVNVSAPSVITISAPGEVSINCTSATITASAAVAVDAPVLTVSAGISIFSGAVQCNTLITNAVVSSLYTPGIGNLL
jgi:uncharacterized protein involved in type VI secretion and phage assembly